MHRWTTSGCLAAVILSTSLALADEPSAVQPASGDLSKQELADLVMFLKSL